MASESSEQAAKELQDLLKPLLGADIGVQNIDDGDLVIRTLSKSYHVHVEEW
jgi:hypothetical protein